MTPKHKEDLQKEFAAFLRKSIEQPIAELPKEFQKTVITVATIRNYCSRIILEDKEIEKINYIKKFYLLTGSPKNIPKDKALEMTAIDLLLHELEENKDAAKPVAGLFKNKTEAPNENTLAFAAFLINLPIYSLEEFKQWKAKHLATTEENNKQSHQTTENTDSTAQTTAQAPKTIEVTTPENPTKTPTFWQKYAPQLFIAASLVLVAISAYAYSLRSYLTERTDKLAYIDQLTFTPVRADSGLLEANVSAQTSDVLPTAPATDNPLVFYTNNIYNGKFLYTTDKWDFATDQKGEDMNSPYGEPYKDQLKGLFKTPNSLPTIANKSIWLRFNVLNKGNQKLYIDNIKLEKVGTYKINPNKVKWNNWITPKDGEKRFELLLTHEPQVAAVVAFAEVPPQNPQHFSLVVNTDTSCENHIYQFRLVVSANDAQGKRYTITSDKVYSLGRLSEL